MKTKTGVTNRKQQQQKEAALSPNLSIITLNIKGLNRPIKRQRFAGCIMKKWPVDMLSIRNLFQVSW